MRRTYQMKIRNCLAIVSFAALLIVSATPANALPVLVSDDGTVSGNRGPFNGTVGTRFTVDSDITINALGFEDSAGDGLLAAHDVGLWLTDGTMLASATVPAGTAGTLDDVWRYVSISDLVLSAGTTYVVGADTVSSDFWSDGHAGGGNGGAEFALGPDISSVAPVNNFGTTGFIFPGNDGTLTALRWGPANATFIGEAVPEPSTLVLTALGLLVMDITGRSRRRRK